MILIAKDKSFYLVGTIMNINKIRNLKKRNNPMLLKKKMLSNKIQKETVINLVNQDKIIKKKMRRIGQVMRKIRNKRKKVKKQKEMMTLQTQ